MKDNVKSLEFEQLKSIVGGFESKNNNWAIGKKPIPTTKNGNINESKKNIDEEALEEISKE